MLCGCLGAEESPSGVDVEGAAPLFWRHVDSMSTAYDAGEAAEDVYSVELFSGFCSGGFYGVGIGDVDCFGDNLGQGEVVSKEFDCLG